MTTTHRVLDGAQEEAVLDSVREAGEGQRVVPAADTDVQRRAARLCVGVADEQRLQAVGQLDVRELACRRARMVVINMIKGAAGGAPASARSAVAVASLARRSLTVVRGRRVHVPHVGHLAAVHDALVDTPGDERLQAVVGSGGGCGEGLSGAEMTR